MKKYIIIIAVTIACLALCAAVWPQTEAVEETPATLPMSSSEPNVKDTVSEAESIPSAEEEAAETPQNEPSSKVTPEPEPVSKEIATTPEVQLKPEPAPEQESAPAPISSPAPPQAVADPQPGDMVYVPGFGWLECQGPGEVIYAEDIYESGNKIGIMG